MINRLWSLGVVVFFALAWLLILGLTHDVLSEVYWLWVGV